MQHKILAILALSIGAAAFPLTTVAAGAPAPLCKPTARALKGEVATARNIKTVQEIYAAFGQGNAPAILTCIAPAAHWEDWADNSAQRAGVPWLKPQSGPEGVAAFFAYVAKWKVNRFAVKNVMGAGANVAAEVEVDFDVTQTGGHYKDQEMHYWTFDEHGMIVGLRHYVDTAKHIAASKGARD